MEKGGRVRKSAPMGKDCLGDNESRLFWSVCYSTSPDAVFTGSTKCLSITPVVIEREMNVSERRAQAGGSNIAVQLEAKRGRCLFT